MNLPQPERRRLCAPCTKTTTHKLVPTRTGCEWVCAICGNVAEALTHDDMRKMLFSAFGGLNAAPPPKERPSTEGVKVFIEHTAGTGEMELLPEFVNTHVEITGKLPVEGERMYARMKGLPPALAVVPYGKVTRVVKPE